MSLSLLTAVRRRMPFSIRRVIDEQRRRADRARAQRRKMRRHQRRQK